MKSAVETLIAELDKSQWWTKEQLQANQERQLVSLLRHHANHNPYFQQRLAEQELKFGALGTLSGLTKLKPFTKQDIQAAGTNFTSRQIPPTHAPLSLGETSGSTGTPVKIKKTRVNEIYWHAHTIRDHQWYNRDYLSRLAAVRATFRTLQSANDWGAPVSALYGSGPGIGIPVITPLPEQNKLLTEFQPNILTVHAGVLQGLVTLWEREGCNLTNLTHIKNVGDTLHDDLRERVQNLLGLIIEDNYSSSEVGCIGIQCPTSGLHHVMAENLIVEILDANDNACKPGEIGRVVVTDLNNLVSPIIRYDLGDYAEVGESCTCGRHLPTLTRVLGRERNLFVKPDGSQIWPQGGYRSASKVVKVRQWQLIQHTPTKIEQRVVTDAPLTAEQEQALVDNIKKVYDFVTDVQVTRFENQIPTVNGKYEETICLVE